MVELADVYPIVTENYGGSVSGIYRHRKLIAFAGLVLMTAGLGGCTSGKGPKDESVRYDPGYAGFRQAVVRHRSDDPVALALADDVVQAAGCNRVQTVADKNPQLVSRLKEYAAAHGRQQLFGLAVAGCFDANSPAGLGGYGGYPVAQQEVGRTVIGLNTGKDYFTANCIVPGDAINSNTDVASSWLHLTTVNGVPVSVLFQESNTKSVDLLLPAIAAKGLWEHGDLPICQSPAT